MNETLKTSATGLGAGTYTCIITYNGICDTSVTITIAEPDQINFSTSKNDVTCFNGNNGSATVNVLSGGNAPFSYQWNTNPVQTIEAPVDAEAERFTSPGVHLRAIADR